MSRIDFQKGIVLLGIDAAAVWLVARIGIWGSRHVSFFPQFPSEAALYSGGIAIGVGAFTLACTTLNCPGTKLFPLASLENDVEKPIIIALTILNTIALTANCKREYFDVQNIAAKHLIITSALEHLGGFGLTLVIMKIYAKIFTP